MSDSIAYNAGHVVGYIAIYGGILWLGYYFGNRLARQRDGIFVRWPMGVALVVVLLLMAGQCSAPSRRDQAGTSANPTTEVDLFVGVAEPEYPDEINPAVLQQFQRDVTRGLEAQFADKLGSIESNISTTKMGGKTIIVYKAIGSRGPHVNQYVGVVKGRRNVVTCASPSGKPFEECLAKTTEVFGKP